MDGTLRIDEIRSSVADGRAGPADAAPAAAAPVPPPLSPEGRGVRGRPGFAWRMPAVGALVVVGVGVLYVTGTLPRLWHDKDIQSAAAAKAAAPLVVMTAVAHRSPAEAERGLPGNCLPMLETSLFARTNGYIQERLVDIGDRVKAGQRLAVITAPDVDDQLAQSKADLQQAQANLTLNKANAELARTTLARDKAAGLLAVPAQQLDQDQATYDTAEASVKAAEASIQVYQATVQRYADLVSFQEITAPFNGVITVRNYDKGALILADSTAALPMFHVAQIDLVRVFVNVPQVFASQIQSGQTAVVYRREDPSRKFSGKVTRNGHAAGPEHPHHADRGRCAEPGRRPAAGHVPPGGLQLSPAGSLSLDPLRGGDEPRRRGVGGRAGRRERRALPEGPAFRGATSARTSRCWTG